MTIPPPQYPVYPHPPPNPPYGPPPPPRMPGLTTTAIVLMWVMVVVGAIGALFTLPMIAFRPAAFADLFGPDTALLMIVAGVQALVWAGLRSYLAVKIARRSAAARTAAIIVEAAGMTIQLVLTVLIVNATLAAAPRTGGFSVNFDCTGIVLPVLVICFLSTAKSRHWCDR